MAEFFPQDVQPHLPESERTKSLSSSGSLLSVSSSSSSPSLPSGFQPSAAHSSSSLASVSLDRHGPCRLWNASQSLSVRFCKRERWIRPPTLRRARSSFGWHAPAAWPVQTPERNLTLWRSCRQHPHQDSRSPPELRPRSARCCTPDATEQPRHT